MIDSDARTVIEQLERRNKEIEIIERVASQISKTLNLDAIAKTMLVSMEEYFNFKHSMILLLDNTESVLKVIATHGYKDEGIGAEVNIGVGVIGMVAKKKKLMRMANLGAQKQYMQAIKQQIKPSKDAAVDEGFLVLNLDVRETQTAAIAFYESRGFVRWGKHPRYAKVDGNWIAGYHYFKDLRKTEAQ